MAVAAILPLLLLACHRPPAGGTDVVASIDGDNVSYAAFEAYLRENVDARHVALGNAVLDRLFDQFVDEQLIVRLALDRGFEVDRDAEDVPLGGSRGGNVPDQRRAVAFLLNQAAPRSWDDAEIVAYYAAHQAEYRRPEGVRLRQILVYERSQAEAARRALDADEDFAQVAARFSQVPMYGLGDEDGRMTRGDLPPAFADSIFELAPGEISEIFTAEYGFHIFQVEERFAAEETPPDEVAAQIRGIFERQRVDELVAAFIAEARERYRVRIHPANFPFDYRGAYAHDENS